MSAPIMPQSVTASRRGTPVRARVAAGTALLLSLLPPAAICRILTQVVRGTRTPTPAEVLEWRDAVNRVSTRCAGNGCLQRSIAVVLLSRMFGAAPVWRTGFRPAPFAAHAWVAIGDTPIGEPAAVGHFLTVLEVVPRHRASPVAEKRSS
ncbi:lasso peptide biosynthesis B2 protein [Micromonospora cathayae]|uniref:Lasso peptide biosynthesis B2 protein n=1 Tax=Micromonospora cathayae TaxID=3028804 RepID=A0ABY7ZUP2_9ACTN|nr:lasso peptide biosynthesis B2 protein [Micromonospora sp. HUAS 3]WDZ86610.1 lasso peptide biosynthesis B2 protein [Micromonospora sp. HUAS 3]